MKERSGTTTVERPLPRPPAPGSGRPAPRAPRAGAREADFGTHLADMIARGAVSGTRLRVAAGAAVYPAGPAADAVYLLAAGRVKTVMHSRSGRTCLLRIHGPGEVLGELAILGGARTESAVAMEPVVVHRVAAEHLQRALEAPAVHRRLIRHLGERLAEQQRVISHLVGDDSEHRLGVALLDLAARLGHPGRGSVCIGARVTQEELAGIVGTTRSRIGLFLRRFCDHGAVEFGRGNLIHVDATRLRTYLEARAESS